MKKEQKQYIGRHFNLGQYFINLYQIVFKLFLPIELISLQDYQGGIFNILIKVAFTLIVHHIIYIGVWVEMSQLMRLWYLSQDDQRRLRRFCASAQSRQSLHCSHAWSMEEDGGSEQNQTSSPTGWLRMHVWRMSLWRTKSTIISWHGSNMHSVLIDDAQWLRAWSLVSLLSKRDRILQ